MDEPKICMARGCDAPQTARGYCIKHYQRLRRKGDFTADATPELERECEIEDCDRVHFARGFCHMHYTQKRRNGEFDPTPQSTQGRNPLASPMAAALSLPTERERVDALLALKNG